MMLPEVGKKYWHYDDGKITPSRQETVVINKVIPYLEVSEELRKRISEEIERYDWIYDDVISHVIFGTNLDMAGHPYKEGDEEIIYLPSEEGWFGFGVNNYWNGGRLDIDGKLTESIQESFYEYCPLFPEN